MTTLTFEVQSIPTYDPHEVNFIDSQRGNRIGRVIAVHNKYSSFDKAPELPKGHVGWIVYVEGELDNEMYKCYVHMPLRRFLEQEFENLKYKMCRIYGEFEMKIVEDINGENHRFFIIPHDDFPEGLDESTLITDVILYNGEFVLRGEKMTQFPIKYDTRWGDINADTEMRYKERYGV